MTTMGELNGLMSRLYTIQGECGGNAQQQKQMEEEANLDEFTRLRRKVAREVKSIRTAIGDREELLGKGGNDLRTVEASANIRSALKSAKEDVARLQTMHKQEETKIIKKAKNKPLDPAVKQDLDQKAEVVSLAFKHIEECENLEKGRYSTAYQRSMIPSGSNGAIIPSSLPEIDDGDFRQLRITDQKIDSELDEISGQVGRLKEVAHAMGKEIKKQEIMMDTIETKVDKATEHLQNLNKRLRDTLEKVRKGDKFILDFILLCILLAIVGYIYNMVRNS